MTQYIIGLFIGLLIGYWYGWISAHQTVKQECLLLGGFYVGEKAFKCVEIHEPTSSAQPPATPGSVR